MEEPYPEHVKLHQVADQSQAIYDFVEWLHNTKRVHFTHWTDVQVGRYCDAPGCQDGVIRRRNPDTGQAEWFNCDKCEGGTKMLYRTEEREMPYTVPMRDLLAEFFDVDLDRLEAEKVAMLEVQRELNRQLTEKEG